MFFSSKTQQPLHPIFAGEDEVLPVFHKFMAKHLTEDHDGIVTMVSIFIFGYRAYGRARVDVFCCCVGGRNPFLDN